MELAEAFATVYRRADVDARVRLNRMLSVALAALSDGVARGTAGEDAMTWLSQMAAATATRRFHTEERPPGLSEDVRLELLGEAEARFVDAIEKQTSWYSDVGERPWSRLLANPGFVGWICDRVGIRAEQLSPTVALGYLYYRRPGDRFPAHVDNPQTHAINCIICLDHTSPAPNARSVLRVLDVEQGWREVALRPGQAVLFNASSTVHERTPLHVGESITLLSIGMNWS